MTLVALSAAKRYRTATPFPWPVPDTLQSLMRAAQADPAAIEPFLRYVAPAVERFLGKRLRPAVGAGAVEVEDAVQSALLRLLRFVKTARLRSEGECWSWVLRVSWHAALDLLPAPSAEAALLRSAWRDGPDVNFSLAYREWESLADWAEEQDPDSPHHQLTRFAVDAQQSLGEDVARLLWLRLVAGETWEQIAAQEGSRPNAVRVRVARALKRARQQVEARIRELPSAERRRLELALEEYGDG